MTAGSPGRTSRMSNEEEARLNLDRLLDSDPREPIEHLTGKFDDIAGDARAPLVLFGAGPLGRRTLVGLRRIGIEPVAFADNKPSAWKSHIDGLEVLPPREAVEKFGHRAVFVVTVYNGSAVRRQLREMDCDRVAHFAFRYWKHRETFLPFCALASPEAIFAEAGTVSDALNVWSDDASRVIFVSQLRWHLAMDSDALPRPSAANDTYFPDDLVVPRDEEVFVDCGAFDGDAIRALLQRRKGRFKGVVALEPDPANYSRLEDYVVSLDADVRSRMDLHPLAAASTNGTAFFDARGDVCPSASQAGNVRISCARLDDVLGAPWPTYLKIDIEGAELDALDGAKDLIGIHRPVLAICCYHQQSDLWQIPLAIKSCYGGYRMFLRMYAEDCWESVCYAIPEERLVK